MKAIRVVNCEILNEILFVLGSMVTHLLTDASFHRKIAMTSCI